MKKIESLLLLSCRSPFLDDSKIYAPMANLYLKSFVNQYLPGVNVVLGDDGYNLSDPEYFKPYDCIGISIMTPQREEALKILHTIKGNYPEKVVIAGGPHVKNYIGNMVKSRETYDWLVPLDGERPLVGILQNNTERFSHRYTRIGVVTGKHVITEVLDDPRILVDIMSKEDIRNAPRPDRTSENAIQLIKNYHYRLGGRESTTAMSARGCPEHCSFCEDAMTPVKRSSLQNLGLEMDDIKNLGYGGVYLFDDLFALSVKDSGEIGGELKKRDLIYRCNSQARYFTKWGEDMAKMLADTGCYEIAFGAETGSQKILDNIHKRTTVEMNYKTIEYANKHGLIVKAFILLGLPGEDQQTLEETEKLIQFLMQSNSNNDFGPYIYYPYKGTQIRDSLDRGEDPGLEMLVSEGVGAYATKEGGSESIIRTKSLSNEELLQFRNYLVQKYKPASNRFEWQDKFRDTHLESKVEYGNASQN